MKYHSENIINKMMYVILIYVKIIFCNFALHY